MWWNRPGRFHHIGSGSGSVLVGATPGDAETAQGDQSGAGGADAQFGAELRGAGRCAGPTGPRWHSGGQLSRG